MYRVCDLGGLIPESFIPVQAFRVGEIILHGIHGRVENKFSSVGTVLGPVNFVTSPLRVGVGSQDK